MILAYAFLGGGFFEHMLHGVDPIFADLHAELRYISLPIGDEGDQAFAEHGVIPFADERVVMPMRERA